ncbi:hypothetical protein [Rhodoplanes sp. Z2-YC6860]|uniref:hypothetical protein n=1 Tax=Rhodoplanes sp. Z2-YC6860 TaxID=674703 RepID=UPI0008313DC1|nr:hypothetical protein [Rhodoplanes sp. Z2-YC6860]
MVEAREDPAIRQFAVTRLQMPACIGQQSCQSALADRRQISCQPLSECTQAETTQAALWRWTPQAVDQDLTSKLGCPRLEANYRFGDLVGQL